IKNQSQQQHAYQNQQQQNTHQDQQQGGRQQFRNLNQTPNQYQNRSPSPGYSQNRPQSPGFNPSNQTMVHYPKANRSQGSYNHLTNIENAHLNTITILNQTTQDMDICWYHRTFGKRAYKCQKPCIHERQTRSNNHQINQRNEIQCLANNQRVQTQQTVNSIEAPTMIKQQFETILEKYKGVFNDISPNDQI
ncbi:MAG: hypothetical protein GY937_07830, partial [bacterium]|nr:hypothetical protein [bacterium]